MKKPKILLYDIETAPNRALVWGKYDQNVLAFEKERELLSFAYKWQGQKKVTCWTREGFLDDKELVEALHDLFQEADIIVTHNGNKFDNKVVKARMLYHHLPPPKTITSVDTRLVAKNYFYFNGNGLNDLCQFLQLGKKMHVPGIELWQGCMEDDAKSWSMMAKYNKHDVTLLEKVYNRLLPWIENHPNIARILNPQGRAQDGCPNCGGTKCSRNGYRATAVNIKQVMKCTACGRQFLTVVKK